MPPERQRAPGAGLAADAIEADRAAEYATIRRPRQIVDDLGYCLPQHRARVEGAPKLARPSWHCWATADRWLEAGP
jgi:hypothetical protein